MRRHLTCVAVVSALALALAPSSFAGTFAGANGRIAYVQTVNGKPQVFTMSPTGADRRPLTSEASGASNPDWSADGRALAFDVGGSRIAVTDANGGGEHLLDATANTIDPSWSANGQTLAVSGVDYDTQGNIEDTTIYTLSSQGQGLNARLFDGSDPVWSPDGNWILYRPTPATTDFCPGIYAVHPDGQGLRHVVDNFPNGSGGCAGGGSDPSFSPDGGKVLYIGPNGVDLFRTNVSGHGVRKLIADRDPKSSPVYSPDGKTILFVTPKGTFTIDARRGGHERRIGDAVSEPAWQPLPR
jgi:Tol biopolymer transport system component